MFIHFLISHTRTEKKNFRIKRKDKTAVAQMYESIFAICTIFIQINYIYDTKNT